jgi:lipopolysaccharide export system protein LptC
VLVVAWPQLGKKPKKFNLDPSRVSVHDSGGQQMINAHFTGTDSTGHPFTVTADTAAQQKQMPDLIDMSFPKADMTMKSGAWVALSAQKGVYDRKTEKLSLSQNVTVFHDSGYEFQTSAMVVDLATSSAEGSAPVTGHGPGGNLSAAGFRIVDRGKSLFFTGKSRMALFPTARAKKGTAKK